MIVQISDTGILIDLERGSLLESTFSCGLSIVVPDLTYATELAHENGPYLKSLGLGIITLTPQELELAQKIITKHPKMSLSDCFAISCTPRVDRTLVSGDININQQNVTIYGLLWLLDKMESVGIPKDQLYSGLKLINDHRSRHLPRDEIRVRLSRWQA